MAISGLSGCSESPPAQTPAPPQLASQPVAASTEPPTAGSQHANASSNDIVAALGTIDQLKSPGLKINRDLSKLKRQLDASLVLANQFPEVRQRCRQQAHPEVEEESVCWKIGLAWRYLSDAMSDPDWKELSAGDQTQVVALLEAALATLPEYSFECERAILLANWPSRETSQTDTIANKLDGLQQQIQEVTFRSHVLGDPVERFALESVPLPKFPDAGEPQYVLEDGKVDVYEYTLSGEDVPGHNMEIRVLLPEGTHAAGSLPCVLVAPAGTDLETGCSLNLQDEEVYVAESLPYVENGFAVIEYSLDGKAPEASFDPVSSRSSYIAFRESGAGLVNARNALEFATQKFAAIDAGRVFSAGHSSGGTVSLLNAAHFPQLKGVIAFAPVADVVKENYSLAAHDVGFKPGVHSFRRKSSPVTHIEHISCPIFLFHAKDDDVVKFNRSEEFVAMLKEAKTDVTFQMTNSGGHYEPMINEGIAKAIAWLKTKGALETSD